MKFFLAAASTVFFALCSQAQVVVVDIVSQQNEFLPNEQMMIGVRIANTSGRELHFGRDNDWLSIEVKSLDERRVDVVKEMPVTGEFTVESPMRLVKLFDIAPYFDMTRSGRYFITARVRIREGGWRQEVSSSATPVDIVRGLTVWEGTFGVGGKSGLDGAPEVRKYTLQKVNLFNNKMKLYLRLTSLDEYKVFGVVPIDFMTSFSKKEAKMDKYNNLHVLLQTQRAVARDWNYSVFGDDGRLILRRTYNADETQPYLKPDKEGLVRVVGGRRRISKSDFPVIEETSRAPGRENFSPTALPKASPAPLPKGFPTLESETSGESNK